MKDSILYTPKDGILHGITRKVVLQLAQKHSLEVIVGHVPTSFFSQFQEAFITSTTRFTSLSLSLSLALSIYIKLTLLCVGR